MNTVFRKTGASTDLRWQLILYRFNSKCIFDASTKPPTEQTPDRKQRKKADAWIFPPTSAVGWSIFRLGKGKLQCQRCGIWEKSTKGLKV